MCVPLFDVCCEFVISVFLFLFVVCRALCDVRCSLFCCVLLVVCGLVFRRCSLWVICFFLLGIDCCSVRVVCSFSVVCSLIVCCLLFLM